MAGSLNQAVKKAIADGFAAHLATLPDFNGTTKPEWSPEVGYGYNFGSKRAERVYFGRARIDSPPASMRAGRNFRDETGRADLVIQATAVGGDQEAADDRAYAIGEQFEEWIADRKNNELGITGLQTLIVEGHDQAPLGNDNGHMCELIYRVRWTARLT